MTVKLSIGGLVREFAFYAPYGWERWIEAGGKGLPALIAFHGGGQSPVGDLPALAAIQAYRDHNGANALTTNPNQPSINGSNTSTLQQWRRVLGVDNPIVEYYSDPNMAHIGFANSPNRYFSVRDVWDWFKAHPRVS